MAGALFFISLFLITLIGGLLLRPDPIQSIRDYEKPAAQESRKQVAREMADFLARNPKIVEQDSLKALPLGPSQNQPSMSAAAGEEATFRGKNAPPSPSREDGSIEIRFQNSNLRFKNRSEFDAWLYESVKSGGIQIGSLIEFGDNAELNLATLKMIHEIDPAPESTEMIKKAFLERAQTYLQGNSPYLQQMAAKAFESYLELEPDRDLGHKTVDEIIQANNKPHP
jgi:hypothetical protein